MNKCLVDANGDIIANTPLFLCEWNGGDNVEIHTRETLYARYKDSGLYDTDEEYGNWLYERDHIFFNQSKWFICIFCHLVLQLVYSSSIIVSVNSQPCFA